MRDEQKDLKTLADAFFSALTVLKWAYGGIGLDPKRPFGNQDVEGDMLELLGWEAEGDDGEGPCFSSVQREYVSVLYREKLIAYLRQRWVEIS